MRKLATIETISEVLPHNNADLLELVKVRGWQVVIRKGEFKQGDLVVFCEIDSWIPNELAPFLSKGNEPREYEGVKGERLRTIRLRGELSQGLVLPIPKDWQYALVQDCPECGYVEIGGTVMFQLGADVTELLGIQKWEPPVSAQLSGQTAGNFPSFIRKTDQERVQNCFNEMSELSASIEGGLDWTIEEKMDGSSCTVYSYYKHDSNEEPKIGVCSRNFELKINEENKDNTFIKAVSEDGYLEHLHKLGFSVALQGEVCGPGIQGNKYKLEKPCFYLFDIYLIILGRYATRSERWTIINLLKAKGVNVNQVPHLGTVKMPSSVSECLLMAEGKSFFNKKQEREGIVFKTTVPVNGKVLSFKAISNKFLLKHDES